MIISGWGNYPRVEARLRAPQDVADFSLSLKTEGPGIARGAGRAYGDAAIGSNTTLSTLHRDRMVAFDPATAEATVEGGTLLSGSISGFLPRRPFPPLAPAAKFCTPDCVAAAN